MTTDPEVGSISRLICRMSVDLPDPDRPMTTWILPAGMEMLMLLSPSTCPCCRCRSALDIPRRTFSTCFAPAEPKILYSSRISIDAALLGMRLSPVLLQAVPVSLADAVEDDRDADDRKA